MSTSAHIMGEGGYTTGFHLDAYQRLIADEGGTLGERVFCISPLFFETHNAWYIPEGTITRDPDLWPMRGRTGVLHSGHWIVDDRDPEDGGTGATFGATASCALSFADLSDEEIDAYVATGEPLGVAGGFTIDGRGGPFVDSVEGDPHAVVGLSLPLLRRLLADIGLGIHELWAPAGAGSEDDAATGGDPAPGPDEPDRSRPAAD